MGAACSSYAVQLSMYPTLCFVSCSYSNYQDSNPYCHLQTRDSTGKKITNSLSFPIYLWRQVSYVWSINMEDHLSGKAAWTKGADYGTDLVGRVKRRKGGLENYWQLSQSRKVSSRPASKVATDKSSEGVWLEKQLCTRAGRWLGLETKLS